VKDMPADISSNAFEVAEKKNNELIVKINEGNSSNDVLQYFMQRTSIESFNEILPSLNEIFIDLVEGTAATTRAFQPVTN
jgi:ABC-2 type transport system ATP-binding protein